MSEVGSHGATDRLEGTQRAYSYIREAIVEGRLEPGQRLVEQQLGDRFGVSRTPVREALRLLEAEGLVVSERNRGAIVRPIADQDIVDVYAIRARLEGLAAERAASATDRELVDDLDRAIDEFETAIPSAALHDDDGIRAVHAANRSFHDTILSMAGSPRLSALLVRTVDVPLVFQAFRRFSTSDLERSNIFHRLIRDAVAAREPARAGVLMAEHIYLGRDALLAALARQIPPAR